MSFPRRSDLMILAEKVCANLELPIPTLRFGDRGGLSRCEDDHILLPTPEWVEKNHGINDEVHGDDPVKVAACYQLTLLHELAHWAEQHEQGDTRHSAFMYATFFSLAEQHGFDLEFAQTIERSYKPRASKQGWKLYQSWLSAA